MLIIECKDKAVKTTLGRKSSYYYDSRDSDIIEEILANHNLEADVESTSHEHKELVQYRASDWDFMMTRAQANSKVCIVENGSVKIAKPDFSSESVQTIAYGATLLAFDAEMDARNVEMQRKLNLKIKYREGFRPFAPSVLIEDSEEFRAKFSI